MYKRFHLDDLGLWAVLLMNLYFIYSYTNDHTVFDNIIIIFYLQSVLIGVFTVLDIITVTNMVPNSSMQSSKGCTGLFFMVHYGGFHFGYLIFLLTLINIKNVEWHFIVFSFYILVTSCLINFIQDKVRNRHEAMNISTMFFMPYLRVIPMHLTILAPKFFNISAPVLFLTLKTIADVLTYIIYRRAVFKPIEQKKAA